MSYIHLFMLQGVHTSWKLVDFLPENQFGPGNS